jgi:hypothetical protein
VGRAGQFWGPGTPCGDRGHLISCPRSRLGVRGPQNCPGIRPIHGAPGRANRGEPVASPPSGSGMARGRQPAAPTTSTRQRRDGGAAVPRGARVTPPAPTYS